VCKASFAYKVSLVKHEARVHGTGPKAASAAALKQSDDGEGGDTDIEDSEAMKTTESMDVGTGTGTTMELPINVVAANIAGLALDTAASSVALTKAQAHASLLSLEAEILARHQQTAIVPS
jgi:hypothetical protein